jgi:hypothetical protein
MAFNPLHAKLNAKTNSLKLRELQIRFSGHHIFLTIWKGDVVCKKGAVSYMHIKADPYNPYYNHYISFDCIDGDVETEFQAFCRPGETYTLSVLLEQETEITHLI